MSELVIQLENVYKSFGARVALKGFSMAILAHTIFGLIGPNGSGKTTTLRLLLNIYRPDSGVVRVLGQDGVRLANDSIGYLPEERGLYRKMQVGTQLKYFARLKGMRSDAIGSCHTRAVISGCSSDCWKKVASRILSSPIHPCTIFLLIWHWMAKVISPRRPLTPIKIVTAYAYLHAS